MPAPVARREFAKVVIDSAIRKALATLGRKPRRAFVHLLGNVQARSELLRPSRYVGRSEAGCSEQIVGGLLALVEHRKHWLRPIEDVATEGGTAAPDVLLAGPPPASELPGPARAPLGLVPGHRLAGTASAGLVPPRRPGSEPPHRRVPAPAHEEDGPRVRPRTGGSPDRVRPPLGAGPGPGRVGATWPLPWPPPDWAGNSTTRSSGPRSSTSSSTPPGSTWAVIEPIVEYLHDQRFESHRAVVGEDTEVYLDPPEPDLSVKGRTVASLMKRVEQWRAERREGDTSEGLPVGAVRHWRVLGVEPRTVRAWSVRELLDGDGLAEEGKAMQHCVATYTGCCLRGASTIWSLGA